MKNVYFFSVVYSVFIFKQDLPTCATSIWDSTLLAASLPRFRFFISSKLISWLVNSDCIFCWKTKTAISKVWGKIGCCFQLFVPVDFETHWAAAACAALPAAGGEWPWPSAQTCGPNRGWQRWWSDWIWIFFSERKEHFSLIRTLKISHKKKKIDKLVASLSLIPLILTVSPGKLRENRAKCPASKTSSSPQRAVLGLKQDTIFGMLLTRIYTQY